MAVVLKLSIGTITPLHRGQEHFWRVLRMLDAKGGGFTLADVMAVSDEPHAGTVATYLRKLIAAGFAERTSEQKPHVYRLTRAPKAAPLIGQAGRSKPHSGQQQMWNYLRGPMARRGFSPGDLVVYASTDQAAVKLSTAKTFVQMLSQAGYLLLVSKGGPGRQAVWRLKPSVNSGPKPPLILRARIVFDQNRNTIVGDVVAEEEPS